MAATERARRWTRDEYHRMAEAGILRPDDRVELIEGEIVARAPQSSSHAVTVQRALGTLQAAFGSDFNVRPQLPLALGEISEPEPDLAVVPGEPEEYLDAHPSSALLVVEIADSSLAFDRGPKLGLYAEAAIPEYWILNLSERTVEVYRRPEGAGYRQAQAVRRSDSLSPLTRPQVSVAAGDLLP